MSELDEGWPGSPAFVVLRMNGGAIERVAEHGDLDDVRDWASISKLAVSMAFGVEMDWDLHSYTEMVGPQGANYANLLSHSSGLGLEESDPVIPIATKRVYSNYGVELAVSKVVGENSAAQWLEDRVFSPLGLASTSLVGSSGRGGEWIDQRPRDLRPSVDAIGSSLSDHSRPTHPSLPARPRRDRAGLWPLCAVSVGDGSRDSWREGALDGGLASTQLRSLWQEWFTAVGQRGRGDRCGGDEHRSLRWVGRRPVAALDQRGARPRPGFVSDALRVGLDLDGSLESLDNSMNDLADALDDSRACELVRFHTLSARRSPDEARLAGRALWAPLWRRGIGPAIDRFLQPLDVIHVAGRATPRPSPRRS